MLRRVVGLAALLTLFFVAVELWGQCCSAESKPWTLGCRQANYMKYQDASWEHLGSIGVHYIFMSVPAPNELETVQKHLVRNNLKVLVMRGGTELSKPECVEELGQQLAICQKMGVHYMFLSPKHASVSKEVAYERLRAIGDVAKKYDVIVALETHPDLGTNADVHLETMRAINHPNIRVNFDSGNITYYNTGRNAVEELKKVLPYLATVEIKDHNGKLENWNFPALGHGVVDIPGVLSVLKEAGYQGPITVEVEGVQGVERSLEQIKAEIAESMDYLRKLARFD